MAVFMYHEPTALSPELYDTVIQKLDEAGAGAPDGRQHHFVFEIGEGRLAVADVWESVEKAEAFGATLGPILQEHGVDGEPKFGRIHNSIDG